MAGIVRGLAFASSRMSLTALFRRSSQQFSKKILADHPGNKKTYSMEQNEKSIAKQIKK